MANLKRLALVNNQMGMPMMVLLLFHTDLICRFGDNDLIFMFTFRRTDNIEHG